MSLAALVAAGCGGRSPRTGGSSNTGPDQGQKKGGVLHVLQNSDFDNIDPGIGYLETSYQWFEAAQRTLYQYKPREVGTPSPDVAASMPRVSPDDRTVRIKLKHGIRFSPPVNREVTSRDVKYAIERTFSKTVANAYTGTYFGSLVGAPAPQSGGYKPIRGIQTPDRYTIVFKLTKPMAGVLAGALVLPASAPVPKEYALRYDQQNPSQYGQHQVSTGPYMYQNDSSGKLTYRPGKSVTLVRNPNWDPKTDWRPAYVDRIEGSIGVDPTIAGRQILTGRDAVSGDTPSAPIVRLGVQLHPTQIAFTGGQGNRYISMNTSKAPFDNVNVRRAVYAALDKEALRKTRGGPVAGDIATHFIQRGLPGYREAGGAKGPRFDFNENPNGNPALAARYLEKAGFKDGRYHGPRILMVGDNEAPADKTAQVVLRTFWKLGFDVNFRSVSHDTMYQAYCNVPKKRVDVCPNVGWIKDFNDPISMFEVPFYGPAISQSNNSNWSQLNDPKINAMIRRGLTRKSLSARARQFGAVDRAVVGTAAAIPWLWDKQPNVESKNVKGVIDLWNATYDLSYTSVK